MINIIIYLNNNSSPKQLVDFALKEGLAASASIDIDNSYYVLSNSEITRTEHSIITLQTKALLFNTIVNHVISIYGPETPIFSVPITQTNEYFDHFIRTNTKKI
jgi:uncharacterized protein involved in tolerance to divalent cations